MTAALGQRGSVQGMGPRDITDVSSIENYIDLGSLLIAPVDGIEVQVQADAESGSVAAISIIRGQSALSAVAFAAPKSGGLWDEVRADIIASIRESNGPVTEQVGAYGPEIITQVPTAAPDGSSVMAEARFLGFDGPRWFCRCVLFGDAVTGNSLNDVVDAIVVRRGDHAMALGTQLPMQIQRDAADPAAAKRDLNPFVRGPEITEVR